MHTPNFWHQPSLLGTLLSPLGALYGAATIVAQSVHVPAHADLPIIAVGNAVLGGAGKTPVTISLARMLQQMGEQPHLLSRGYGGTPNATPLRVDVAQHNPNIVGDEPLLLAHTAPCWVHKKRDLSAVAAHQNGASVCIMDDGLQHTSLHRDLSLLVIDTHYGNGNGHIFPAGPLREPFARALDKAHALVLIGKSPCTLALPSTLPQFRASIMPDNAWLALRDKPVIAFAGLARPSKFFALCEASGMRLIETFAFPDHHRYSRNDIAGLLAQAKRAGATLVCTEKDGVKLTASEREQIHVLPITIAWQNEPALQHFLSTELASIRAGAIK